MPGTPALHGFLACLVCGAEHAAGWNVSRRSSPVLVGLATKGCEPIQVAICIPARNEAEELPGLFAALDGLTIPDATDVVICLALDGCTDTSFDLAEAYRMRSRYCVMLDEMPATSSNAGRARHASVVLGLGCLTSSDGILLTTDADSAPACDWVARMVQALEHADVVAGRIIQRGQAAALQARVEAYYDMLFSMRRMLDPVPWEAPLPHHQTGGANLGMRSSSYTIAGGFRPLVHGEDATFIDDASRAGLRVRRDAACVVSTSNRRLGRVAGGMASTLRMLDRSAASDIEVSHPADMAWQYDMQAKARLAYETDRLDMIAAALGLTTDHALGVARDCPNGEAFAMRIVPEPPGGMRTIPLLQAEAQLDLLMAARQAA